MKKIILLLFCIPATLITVAQENDSLSYIVVTIKKEWDRSKRTDFYSLAVENGNKAAADLYSLKPYSNKRIETDPIYQQNNKFEDDNKNKDGVNYFINTSAALNYLAGKGWTLEHVYIDITTKNATGSSPNGSTINYPNITSEPVYIFKKRLAGAD